MKRPKPSIPDYGKSMRERRKQHATASKDGCEICGTTEELYVFVRKGKTHCSCKKHLRRIK